MNASGNNPARSVTYSQPHHRLWCPTLMLANQQVPFHRETLHRVIPSRNRASDQSYSQAKGANGGLSRGEAVYESPPGLELAEPVIGCYREAGVGQFSSPPNQPLNRGPNAGTADFHASEAIGLRTHEALHSARTSVADDFGGGGSIPNSYSLSRLVRLANCFRHC